jgi:hypothetical protein
MAPKEECYRRMRRRLRRTLHYGGDNSARMINLSLSISEMTVAYFDRFAPFDSLDMDYAVKLSREAHIDPCTFIVAFVYIDRLRRTRREFFESSDPADLYLIALILSSKYLHDSDDSQYLYNDEWATSASKPLQQINERELTVLTELDWNLKVTTDEFRLALESIEYHIADRTIKRLGFGTYTELACFSHLSMNGDFLWHQLVQPLVSMIGLVSLAYASVAIGVLLTPMYLNATSASRCSLLNQPIDIPIAHSTGSLLLRTCADDLLATNPRQVFSDMMPIDDISATNRQQVFKDIVPIEKSAHTSNTGQQQPYYDDGLDLLAKPNETCIIPNIIRRLWPYSQSCA